MNYKINNIQALRAFAAIAVAILHTKYALPHMPAIGAFGVDIFFVISGYIMARIFETNSSLFFRRRLIRILPPYWAMTFLLFVFAWKFPQLLQATQANGQELIKSLFFIPFYKSNGLLRPLLFVGWSLNYEMFFYAALTTAMLILPRHPLLLATGFILTTVSICYPFAAYGAIPAFYSSGMMVEFIFGIVAYVLARSVSITHTIRFRSLSLLCLAASIIAIALNEGLFGAADGWHKSMINGFIGFVMITSASLLSQGGWDIKITSVVLIGDASYVLYLLHPYCELLIGRVVARRVPLLAINHLFGCMFAVAISIALAVLLHLKLEMPVVNYLNSSFGGKRRSTEFRTTT
jgi:exopolysaccharide production protein ExoZ